MTKVLFVCIHNAGRSQMAQAFLEAASDGSYVATSAGTDPAGRVHPEVVQVMAEKSIDISDRRPARLTEELAERVDVVVTMGCGDACPYILGKRYIDWDLPDPAGLSLDRVRAIRDEIERRVLSLLREDQLE